MNINLVVNGTSYPISGVLARCTLNDAVALKLQTGIGMKTINEGILRMNELPGGMASPDVFEDVDLINVLRAMVWAARRQVGEKLSVEEANDFSWTDAEWVVTDDAGNEITGEEAAGTEDGADDEADPTQPPAKSSDPADVPAEIPAPKTKPRSGRTSKTSASQS